MTRNALFAGILACLALAACSGEPEAFEAAEEAVVDLGPAVGASVPSVSLVDAAGERRDLANLTGENGLVLYFNRSLDWCPFCQAQVIEIEAALDAFESRGYAVAVITYDEVETLAMFADRRDVSLTLLADPDSVAIDAFGVRDPVYADPENYAFGVPYPVTFVIDPEGRVQFKFWHEPGLGQEGGYRIRVSVEDVLDALDARR